MSTKSRIEAIPGWQRSNFLTSLHAQATSRGLTARQLAALMKIEAERGIVYEEPKPVVAKPSDLTFMEPSTKGWERAWAVIVAKYGDAACECPRTGETWQYMCTAVGQFHEFRHRSYNGVRRIEHIPVQADDFATKVAA